MKRLFSVVLALILAFSLTTTALAAEKATKISRSDINGLFKEAEKAYQGTNPLRIVLLSPVTVPIEATNELNSLIESSKKVETATYDIYLNDSCYMRLAASSVKKDIDWTPTLNNSATALIIGKNSYPATTTINDKGLVTVKTEKSIPSFGKLTVFISTEKPFTIPEISFPKQKSAAAAKPKTYASAKDALNSLTLKPIHSNDKTIRAWAEKAVKACKKPNQSNYDLAQALAAYVHKYISEYEAHPVVSDYSLKGFARYAIKNRKGSCEMYGTLTAVAFEEAGFPSNPADGQVGKIGGGTTFHMWTFIYIDDDNAVFYDAMLPYAGPPTVFLNSSPSYKLENIYTIE
ncbi:hypothetical protein FACS1894191_4430 [Clostridia bacterium]|nr:hypothetical protein FACS1894191_4430 [Clostridia bacterium]